MGRPGEPPLQLRHGKTKALRAKPVESSHASIGGWIIYDDKSLQRRVGKQHEHSSEVDAVLIILEPPDDRVGLEIGGNSSFQLKGISSERTMHPVMYMLISVVFWRG